MSANHIIRIIPVLKINNRHLNQEFFVNQLGMKALLEEAAFLSLGDQTKTEKLQLEESYGRGLGDQVEEVNRYATSELEPNEIGRAHV